MEAWAPWVVYKSFSHLEDSCIPYLCVFVYLLLLKSLVKSSMKFIITMKTTFGCARGVFPKMFIFGPWDVISILDKNGENALSTPTHYSLLSKCRRIVTSCLYYNHHAFYPVMKYIWSPVLCRVQSVFKLQTVRSLLLSRILLQGVKSNLYNLPSSVPRNYPILLFSFLLLSCSKEDFILSHVILTVASLTHWLINFRFLRQFLV